MLGNNKLDHINIGKIGEEVACLFLMKHGIKIISRNYMAKTGELDIIGQEKEKIIFYEVKTFAVSDVNKELEFSPEENLHKSKIKKIKKTAQIFLLEKGLNAECPFEIHGIIVLLSFIDNAAKIKIINNINIF